MWGNRELRENGQRPRPSDHERRILSVLVGCDRTLEAYYFAHSEAVNSVAGVAVLAADHPTDVEQIGHPKSELKRCWKVFDEVDHGRRIVPLLDLEHVLSRPQECCSLRAMFAWCVAKLIEAGAVWDDTLANSYRLTDGCRSPLTSGQ